MTSLFSRLQKLNKEATPLPFTLDRYSHGGGRCYLITEDTRTLVADFYNEPDRELFWECRNSLPAVLNLIEAAQREVDQHEDVVHAIEAREALEQAVAVFVTPEGDRSTMSGQEEQP